MWLAAGIAKLGPYQLISKGDELPVFAFRTRPNTLFSVYDVSAALRAHGWLVPAYPMPEGMEDISVLRIVVRNGLSRDLARMLLADLGSVTEHLSELSSHLEPKAAEALETEARKKARTGFHH
jgi:glutamate decarboxylase